ncbi:MAG: extracellular solute-binding protein [Myxococcales bacterium]|nr:extracellular solute-binding protein [Myxococcales bacterium]
MKRAFFFALLASGVAAAQTDLVVWHSYRAAEKSAIEKVAASFNASHPGIKVTTLAVPYDAFADKISAAVPRGKGPDIFIYAQDRLGGWIEAGNTVEPIDFFVDDATKARFIPSTMEAMTYRGTVWGLPVNYKVITLIYNKKLVQKPPATTTELVTLAKKLTDKASGRFGLAYWYSDYYYHAALQNAFGGRVFEGNTAKPVLNAPENVKGLELLVSWIDEGILPAEPSTALITALFNGGKAAMIFTGPWFLGEIDPGIDWGLAPLPKVVEAGGKPLRPWMTVEGAFIAAPSKHKDAAYEFVKFLTDLESAKVMALEGRQSPSNKAAYDDPKVANDPVLKAFRTQVEVAVPMPNLPEMTMVWSPATIMMASVAKRTIAPKPALDKAEAEVLKAVSELHRK